MITGLLAVGIVWALFIAPLLMDILLNDVLGIPSQVLSFIMPSIMRSGMMFIWLILLLFPLSNALKEIKIGQWEILLSNNVSSRAIFTGSFLGKLPMNGLLVIFLSPIIVSPFALALNVSVIGQAFIYCTITVFAISTIWVADFIVVYIQSKLGASSRGKELANAMALIVAFAIMAPLIGFQIFGDQMIALMGTDVLLFLPFTWSADLITRFAFIFNGVDLSASTILALDAVLGLDIAVNVLLLVCFVVGTVTLALVTTESLFTANIGERTERVTTISKENPLYRFIRKIAPGSFGIVLVTTLKDFSRKPQNLMRLVTMFGMAVFFPILIGIMGSRSMAEVELVSALIMTSLAFAVLAPQAFGGIGFLESKDQLWIIQSVPSGAKKFAVARAVQAFLFITLVALIPSIVLTILLNQSWVEAIILFVVPIITGTGGALVGIGISAGNPTYEDANSAALKANVSKSMGITIVSFMLYTIIDLVLGIVFDLGDITQLISANQWLYLTCMLGPLFIVGVFVFIRGIGQLSRHE